MAIGTKIKEIVQPVLLEEDGYTGCKTPEILLEPYLPTIACRLFQIIGESVDQLLAASSVAFLVVLGYEGMW